MGAIINKYYKIIVIELMIFFLACFLSKSSAIAQDNSKDKLIISMLNSFYQQYIRMIAEEEPRFYKKKMDSLLEVHCSKNFLTYLQNCELSYDPFLKAQDASIVWLNSLTVKKDYKQKSLYNVTYYDNYSKKIITIHLNIKKENEKFKIDSIW